MRCFLILVVSLAFSHCALSQSNSYVDSLLQKLNSTSEVDQKIKIYVGVITHYLDYEANRNEGLEYIDELAALPECAKCEGIAQLFHGHFEFYSGDIQASIHFYRQAAQSSKEADDQVTYNKAMAWVSSAYVELQQYERAKEVIDSVILYCKENDFTEGLADSYFMLGILNYEQGYFKIAIDSYLRLDSLLKLNPESNYLYEGGVSNNLGQLFRELKDFEKAEYYIRAAKDIFIKEKDSSQINLIDKHLAILESGRRNFTLSNSILYETLRYYSKINNTDAIAEIDLFLGINYVGLRKYDSAVYVLDNAIELYGTIEDKLSLAEGFLYRSRAYLALDNLLQAEMDIEKANQFVKEVDVIPVRLQVISTMISIEKKIKNYERVLDLVDERDSLKAIFEEELKQKEFYETETKYQTEKQQQQIELLTTQNQLARQEKQNQLYLLLGILLIVFIVAVFFYVLYRNRQKTTTKLQELDTIKSTFFANISHEFRTPLTLIKGPVEDQLPMEQDEKKRANLELIDRNADKLLSLVDQLLDLSKLEAGSMRLKVEQSALSPFISALASSFDYAATQKSIDFKSDISDQETPGWFDKDVVEKIVINLLSNAFKYTPDHGEINLQVEIDEQKATLIVKNTGKGIAKEDLDNVFKRFYQAGAGKAGVGIGLSLVKELVSLHKGSVSVDSEENGWTEFTVEIPISKTSYRSDEMNSPHVTSDSDMQPHPINDRVVDQVEDPELVDGTPILLIVEDNADVRSLIKSAFDTAYTILEAENGEEGIKKAIDVIPDVIISDVMMPVKDGVELSQTLKSDERTSHIPIILLTAKAGEENEIKGLETGADEYMVKPFNKDLLKVRVQKLVEMRAQLRQRYSQEVILRPKDIAISSTDEKFLERMQALLDAKLNKSAFNAEVFSQEMGMSRMQLHRKLKALIGLTTSEFIRSQRLKMAVHLLETSDITISEVGYAVGFNDPSYFSRCFKEEYGCTAMQYAANLKSSGKG